MNGRQARALRQTEAQAIAKSAGAVQPAIDAALFNEQLTRKRVEHVEALLYRGFWGRLRWLFLGK